MPREIRDVRQWYRIDKQTGVIAGAYSPAVVRAAQAYFHDASPVLASGRFQVPFAVYALGRLITDAEHAAHAAAITAQVAAR